MAEERSRETKPPRWKRWGRALSLLFVDFVALIVLGLLVLNTDGVRSRIARFAGEQVSGAVNGSLEIARLDHLDLSGVSGVDARVLARDGTVLVEGRDLSIDWELGSLVTSLLGGGPLVVDLPGVRADSLEVDLQRTDEAGSDEAPLKLVQAFSSSTPKPEQPEATGPSVLLRLRQLSVDHVTVHYPSPQRGTLAARLDDLRGHFRLTKDIAFEANAKNADVELPELSARLSGKLTARGSITERGTTIVLDEWEGAVGGAQLTARGVLDVPDYALQLEVRGSSKQWGQLTTLGDSLPGGELRAFVQGDFEFTELAAVVDTGDSLLHLVGSADFEQEAAQWKASTRPLKLRTISKGAPDLAIESWLQGEVAWAGELQLSVGGATKAVRIHDRRVPPLAFRLKTNGERLQLGVTAPGCDCVHAAAIVDTTQQFVHFATDLRLTREQLQAERELQKLRVGALSPVRVEAEGHLDYGKERIEAEATVDVDRLEWSEPSFRLSGGRLRLDARGALSSPFIDARLTVQNVRAKEGSLSRLLVTARGQPPRLRVAARGEGTLAVLGDERLRVRAETRLVSLSPVYLEQGSVVARRADRDLLVRFASLELGSVTRLERLLLRGPGTVRANARWEGEQLEVTAGIFHLDLAEAHALGAPWVPALSGTLGMNVDLRAKLRESTLHVHSASSTGIVENLGYIDQQLRSARWSLSAEQGKWSGTVRADLPNHRGWARTRVEQLPLARLLREPMAPWSLEQAGSVLLEASVQAETLPKRLFTRSPSMSGRVQLYATVDKRPGTPFTLELQARTVGFALSAVESDPSLPPGTGLRERKTPWSFQRLNARVLARYEGGAREAKMWVRLHEPVGARLLMEANVTSSFPGGLERTFATGRWKRLPIQAVVRFPNGDLSLFPVGILPSGASGTLGGNAVISGTLDDPIVQAHLDVKNFSVRSTYESYPVTLHLDGTYLRNSAHLKAVVEHEGKIVVRARGHSRDLSSWFDSERRPIYQAGLHVDMLPLGCFPYVRDYAISGRIVVNGELVGADTGTVGDLVFRGHELQVIDVPFRTLEAEASVGDGEYAAQVLIVQADGRARLEARGRTSQLDAEASPLGLRKARVLAKNLEIRPLRLALRDVLSELSGRVTGNVSLDLEGGKAQTSGALVLKKGTLQLAALGQQLQDVEARITAHPGGKVDIDDISARALSGKIKGSAGLEYDWDGLHRLEGHFEIPEDEPYPVTYEGLPLGEVTGTIRVAGQRENEQLALKVVVPTLDLHVEQQLDVDVQSLEPPESVRLGARRESGEFVAYDALTTESEQARSGPSVEIEFGDDVWIHRGQGVFASLQGDVTVQPDGTLDGQLSLNEGQIDVLGRVFEVRQGILTFRGASPPNPVLIAQAAWEAPSGYVVIAEFRGPVRSGTMTLQSDPPLTQSQVMNVLLFDDPQGNTGAGDGGNPAGALATTIATSGLGRALSDLSDLQITAGVDTSEENTARPELAVRISPRLSIEVQYNPDGGAGAVTRTPDRALLSLEVRLASRWSVETTVGDQGTSIVDFMWRYRY